MKANQVRSTPANGRLQRAFAVGFGGLLGLALLKFGNPALFDSLVSWPTNGYEWALNPWPIAIGHGLLVAVALVGVVAARRAFPARLWLAALPAVWLGWQCLAATQTVDAELTRATLKHFAACVACFYLGLFALASVRLTVHFFWPIIAGFLLMLAVGFQQQFGGLEASREYFFTYVYPQLPFVSPEYLKKISSERIFSTQFYPNALAGVILLLLPMTLTVLWQHLARFTAAARGFLAGMVAMAALACLFWSGSKGGWLLLVAMVMIVLLRLPVPIRLKVALAGIVLVVSLAGFGWRYAAFFQRGATSVIARFDYWEAAMRTAAGNPMVGTGPGTFQIAYQAIKRPESEMARLAHNDYLQQASDSGWPGFAAYLAWVLGTLHCTRPSAGRLTAPGGVLRFSVWLGLVGWSLQSLLEFGLYIPALAWCGFGWMGWLLATTARPGSKRLDKPASAGYAPGQ